MIQFYRPGRKVRRDVFMLKCATKRHNTSSACGKWENISSRQENNELLK